MFFMEFFWVQRDLWAFVLVIYFFFNLSAFVTFIGFGFWFLYFTVLMVFLKYIVPFYATSPFPNGRNQAMELARGQAG